jgi:hypothetical protein
MHDNTTYAPTERCLVSCIRQVGQWLTVMSVHVICHLSLVDGIRIAFFIVVGDKI